MSRAFASFVLIWLGFNLWQACHGQIGKKHWLGWHRLERCNYVRCIQDLQSYAILKSNLRSWMFAFALWEAFDVMNFPQALFFDTVGHSASFLYVSKAQLLQAFAGCIVNVVSKALLLDRYYACLPKEVRQWLSQLTNGQSVRLAPQRANNLSNLVGP